MTLERSIMRPDLIIHNAKIATNSIPSFVQAIAVADGKVVASGTNQDILRLRGPETRVIDAVGRTVIPGLNDSHMHPIRGGLNYNMELRWDGFHLWPTPCACSRTRQSERLLRSGCGSWEAGMNSSLPSAECQHWTRSILQHQIHRSS